MGRSFCETNMCIQANRMYTSDMYTSKLCVYGCNQCCLESSRARDRTTEDSGQAVSCRIEPTAAPSGRKYKDLLNYNIEFKWSLYLRPNWYVRGRFLLMESQQLVTPLVISLCFCVELREYTRRCRHNQPRVATTHFALVARCYRHAGTTAVVGEGTSNNSPAFPATGAAT